MKYLEEFRSPELVKEYLAEIHSVVTKQWNIMEICGGQTHSLVKNGILDLLPDKINMIHGPGCPVCVTDNSNKEVVFFAVGFETTAPPNSLSVIQAQAMKLTNYSILTSHVLVPPALEAIFADTESEVNGVLAAGHVCAIMGTDEYDPIAAKYKRPIVVTGFEPVDLLHGILELVKQLEADEYKLDNAYKRVVKKEGTPSAINMIFKVFEISDRDWRGIGTIPESGYQLKKEFEEFDAHKKFNVQLKEVEESKECIAGTILKGIKKPNECPQFGKKCTPEHPLGAPMVSSEGACAAYFHVSDFEL